MRTYLIKASYNGNGAKGLIEDGGTRRRSEVERMIASMGGKMESFYFAFGETDAYITAELPDDTSALAIGLRVNASGLVTTSTTVLLKPEEVDAAAKHSVSYRAPGQK